MEEDLSLGENGDSRLISPYCVFESNMGSDYSSGRLSVKSLVNQSTSVDTLLCNFLRIEEESVGNGFSGTYNSVNFTTNWMNAYLSEGSISTIPNANNKNLRSISLYPEQPYNTESPNVMSRMIGWYPRTTNVPETASGTDASIQFHSFQDSTCVLADNKVSIKFKYLDGSKDVMVSDVRDGSYSSPFSSLSGRENFFTFKHYLSAVRIYAKAERSSQDIGMWGEIKEVVIMGQSTTCIVELPQEYSPETPSSRFASNVIWGNENAKFPIQKTYLFGSKDVDNSLNIIPDNYPISLQGTSVEKYLGYSLIQPDKDLRIQVHTKAGVYNVVVSKIYNSQEIFKAGYIYDLHLDFKTDGTILAFLENEGAEKYFDLTKGVEYRIDSDGDGDTDSSDDVLFRNKFANCYMIYSNPSGTDQKPAGTASTYDGFCFDASIVGNGEGGIISTGAQTLYPTDAHIDPVSADVLWETSPRLITQIELMHDHIRFKVAKNGDGSFTEGNAVLAAYDKDKKILWSWHIWITDKPVDILYTEVTTKISIMDRNLGATYGGVPNNGELALETYGLYYQWGRKDPSMGPPRWDYSPINMTTAPYYDYSSDMKNSAEVMRFAAPTLQNAVENPMYLIMPTAQTQTYYFNWLHQKIDFLWGYSITSGNTHKTIYDPCPYGYRVSGGELADLFAYATTLSSPNGISRNDYGQNVVVPDAQVFFPYSGFKGVDRGLNSLVSSWKYVGQKGDYQSAIVSRYTGDEEYYMHRSRIYISKERTWTELNVGQYTGYQIQDHTNRRTAAPVRCVKDQNHNRISAFLTPDKYTISNSGDEIKFKLFAESFMNNISSARLVLGYHPKTGDVVGEHIDKTIWEWSNINNKQWSVSDFTYNFSTHFMEENGTAGKIDITQTTGEFRFVLYVKTSDNVNKISSTTITLVNNNVDFTEWDKITKEYFVDEPVDRKFRIYGHSKPVNVKMIINSNTSEPVDITSNLSVISGSVQAFDYYCSTTGNLSFNATGTHNVYFIITFDNGSTITTEAKTISVAELPTGRYEVLTSNNYDPDALYIIKSANTNSYIYDGGQNMRVKSTSDYSTLFRIIKSGNEYKISNVVSKEYVAITEGWNSATLYIRTTQEYYGSLFTLNYSNDNFTISRNNYYWTLNNGTLSVDAGKSNNNNNAKWIIYKVIP